MSTDKLFKVLILVLTVAAIGFVLVPSSTAKSKVNCGESPNCIFCYTKCEKGYNCEDWWCVDGSSGSSCSRCDLVKKQPGDFQKGTHGEQVDKALLAQLLSKDPEISQALRSLR